MTLTRFLLAGALPLAVSGAAWAATPAAPGKAAAAKAEAGASAAVAPTAAPAAAKLVQAGSEITFTAKQVGVPLEGRFKRFDAQVAFDPRRPEGGRVALQIELGSVSLDPETDAELGKGPWFDTSRFPKAGFASTAIRRTGPGRFDVSGTLTIKGQARPLVVPVSLSQSGGATTATGAFVLKRLDFKVGEGEWGDTSVVANEVQVRFKLLLQGVPPL